MAITDSPGAVKVGPVTHIELGIVVEVGKTKLAQVGDVVHSGRWHQVHQRDLEDFANKVLSAIDAVGMETVTHAVDEILRDRSSAETLRKAAEKAGPLFDEVATRSAEKVEPTDPTRRHAIRWWILAAAILLAAGVAAVPIIGSVTVEIVLTNELAFAAAAAALAALLKTK